MLKYRTQWEKIEAIEVARETKTQIVTLRKDGGEDRESKRAGWRNWHDSWEDAHNFLLSVYGKKIQELQRRIDDENEKLKLLLEMKNTGK